MLPTTMPNMFLKYIPSNVLVSQMTTFFPPDQIYPDDVYKQGNIRLICPISCISFISCKIIKNISIISYFFNIELREFKKIQTKKI